MIFAMIFALVITILFFIATSSIYVFAVYAGFLLLILLYKLIYPVFEDHPMYYYLIIIIALIATAIISIILENIITLLATLFFVGLFKGLINTTDFNSSWFNTPYFTIDKLMCSVFTNERNREVVAFGFILFGIIETLLIVPRFFLRFDVVLFFPALFYIFRMIRFYKHYH